MRVDVAIVGGGLGGLLCAARLARAGFSVKVWERASHVGGRAMSPTVAGTALNLGAHALYAGGPAERMLVELGISYDGFAPSARNAWLTDEGKTFPSPSSIMSLFSSKLFSFGERVVLMRFFAMLETRMPSPSESTTAWLDRIASKNGSASRARRFLDAMTRVATYSNMPDTLPAEIAARQLRRAIGLRASGVIYVDRTWQSLVDQAVTIAEGAGAIVATSAHVTSLRDLDARHVVVALPRNAAAHLVSLEAEPPVRAACIDMTLDAPVSKRLVIGMDAPHYFSVHSREEPLRAHALRYLAPGEIGAECKDVLENWLKNALPELDARVIGKRFLPDMDVASALVGSSATSIEGVSFVGDWTSAKYQLLDAVAESVETVCARLDRERRGIAA
jgi:phytoene dehydrogenase-like protein